MEDPIDTAKLAHEFLSLVDALGIEGDYRKTLLSLPAAQKQQMIDAQKKSVDISGAEIAKRIKEIKKPFSSSYEITHIEAYSREIKELRFNFVSLTESEVLIALEENLLESIWEIISMLSSKKDSQDAKIYMQMEKTMQNKPIYQILEPTARFLKSTLQSPAVVRSLRRDQKMFQNMIEHYPSPFAFISSLLLEIIVKCLDAHIGIVLDSFFKAAEKSSENHAYCLSVCNIRMKWVMDEVEHNLKFGQLEESHASVFLQLIMGFYKESPMVGIMLDGLLRMCGISRVLSRVESAFPGMRKSVSNLLSLQQKVRAMAVEIDVRKIDISTEETKKDVEQIISILSVLNRINSSRMYDVLQFIRGQIMEESVYRNKDAMKIEQERAIRKEKTQSEKYVCICKDILSRYRMPPEKIASPETVSACTESEGQKKTGEENPGSTLNLKNIQSKSIPPMPGKSSIPPIPPKAMPGKSSIPPIPPKAMPGSIPPIPPKTMLGSIPPIPPKTMPGKSIPPIPPKMGIPPKTMGIPPKTKMSLSSLGAVPPLAPGGISAPPGSGTFEAAPPGPRSLYMQAASLLHPENPQQISYDVHIRKPAGGGLWCDLSVEDLRVFTKADFRVFERKKTEKTVEDEKIISDGVIDKKRCKAIDIILARVKVPHEKLIQSVDALNTKAFTETLLAGLIHNYPTEEELELIKKHPVELAPEIFYKKALSVEMFREKLVIMHLLLTVSSVEKTLIPSVKTLIEGCSLFLRTKSIHRILKITLGVVNVLNSGGKSQGAWGIRVDSLPRVLENSSVVLLVQEKVKQERISIAQELPILREVLKISTDIVETDCLEGEGKRQFIEALNLKKRQREAVREAVSVLESLQILHEKWGKSLEELKAFLGEKEFSGSSLQMLSKYVIGVCTYVIAKGKV
ncbi:uncharacterized protein NEMAJ01_2301 [Nematocida major]|uniref:uncharacterized protein n=1 Tax=Nematocida major TaxID=1912982 RepID=UPI0020076228|nr:uncharacterized protein NEMAJ01_2301 [Nematocida major]KAH9387405.1 hypothetical protein NEMAJ01_2301 [Nematocida major]